MCGCVRSFILSGVMGGRGPPKGVPTTLLLARPTPILVNRLEGGVLGIRLCRSGDGGFAVNETPNPEDGKIAIWLSTVRKREKRSECLV